MALENRNPVEFWIEYQATYKGSAGCTIATSAYGEVEMVVPFDTWLWLMVEKIYEEHPEATDVRLLKRELVKNPPVEVVRKLELETGARR